MKDFLLQLKTLLQFRDIMGRKPSIFHPETETFERNLCSFLGIGHAVAVASGTDALILSLKAAGVEAGDEVIIPALGFYSSAGAAAWIGAVPVFVDVEEDSFNADPAKIERAITPRTKAVIIVHLNGVLADMEKIAWIAKKRGVFLIEDAAHALGSHRGGRHPGYFSDAACFSFNPQKMLRGAGDGGAVATKDPALATRLRMMTAYGSAPDRTGAPHTICGVASRLHPLQAVMLDANLKTLAKKVGSCRKNYLLYAGLLEDVRGVTIQKTREGDSINGYRPAILSEQRNTLFDALRGRGIGAEIQYAPPLHLLGAFSYLNHKKGDFPSAERISERIIVLPNDEKMKEADIKLAASVIKNVARFSR